MHVSTPEEHFLLSTPSGIAPSAGLVDSQCRTSLTQAAHHSSSQPNLFNHFILYVYATLHLLLLKFHLQRVDHPNCHQLCGSAHHPQHQPGSIEHTMKIMLPMLKYLLPANTRISIWLFYDLSCHWSQSCSSLLHLLNTPPR